MSKLVFPLYAIKKVSVNIPSRDCLHEARANLEDGSSEHHIFPILVNRGWPLNTVQLNTGSTVRSSSFHVNSPLDGGGGGGAPQYPAKAGGRYKRKNTRLISK